MMFEFMTIRELFEIVLSGSHVEIDSVEYVQLQGWIRTNRSSGKIGFIELNDGTYFRNAQLVYSSELKDFDKVEKYTTGTAITVTGKFVYTPQGRQPFEIQVKEVELEGECAHDYPLQKKRHSFEFMREIPHLRPRANSFYAIFRLRSVLSMAIHEFFQNQGFVYVHTPVITGNDAEGAGETFTVTTREDDKLRRGLLRQACISDRIRSAACRGVCDGFPRCVYIRTDLPCGKLQYDTPCFRVLDDRTGDRFCGSGRRYGPDRRHGEILHQLLSGKCTGRNEVL